MRLPKETLKELDHLMERLYKGNAEERRSVTTRLIDYERSGKIPLEALLEMGDDPNPTVSMYAITALGRNKQPAAVNKLLDLAERHRAGNPLFVEQIVDALGEAASPTATALLMDFLGVKTGWKHKLIGKLSLKREEVTPEELGFRAHIALAAVRALVRIEDAKAGEAFAVYLEHEDPVVRWHCIQGILRCRLTDAVPRLRELAAQDPSDTVREMADIALGRLSEPPRQLMN